MQLNLELLAAELKEKGKKFGTAIGLFLGAGLLSLYAIGFALTTIAVALALVLPLWLSLLIVTLVLFLIVAILALVGRDQLRKIGAPAPGVAIAEAKATADLMKTNARETAARVRERAAPSRAKRRSGGPAAAGGRRRRSAPPGGHRRGAPAAAGPRRPRRRVPTLRRPDRHPTRERGSHERHVCERTQGSGGRSCTPDPRACAGCGRRGGTGAPSRPAAKPPGPPGERDPRGHREGARGALALVRDAP